MAGGPAPGDPRILHAAVIAVGSELTEGIRTDTNGPEVSRALAGAGWVVSAREQLPDDRALLAGRIASQLAANDLVVVTGGLGPTHDDVTRDAAADALGVTPGRDPALERALGPVVERHTSPQARAQVLRQALVLPGAKVLAPSVGTAPGQLLATAGGARLLLLPGPPREMRPMLAEAIALLSPTRPPGVRTLGCVGLPESDAQVMAEEVLAAHPGVALTVLARPSLVDVVLLPRGADAETLDAAADAVAARLGEHCYAIDGSSLAATVLRVAREAGVTIATAESCTGGLVSAELTAVAGSSATFTGGVVAYSDPLKRSLLGVSTGTLASNGAVSEAVAREMAEGGRRACGADVCVAITGIAGPGGGTTTKPVGTVWFACASRAGTAASLATFSGDREVVRARATVRALDLLRRAVRPGG